MLAPIGRAGVSPLPPGNGGDGAPGTLESGCYDSYSVLKKNAPFYQGSAPKNQTTENA